MPNLENNDDDYKFLSIVDALISLNQKVNLIGVVTETGIAKHSRGTDCCCSLKIVDETHPSPGISVNFFAEIFEKLPCVKSAGDIIQLSRVVIKNHRSGVNALFDKRFSSFAIYNGSGGSNLVPYQVSCKFHPGKQDNKFIERLRKWTVSHQPERAPSCSSSLSEIKIAQGHQFDLICKVLHISEVTKGESIVFVWDGTDAPPVDVHTQLDEELENPIPLHLEASPLSRDILCTFPAIGTVLRMTPDRCNDKMALHSLKAAGTWVHFKNISFQVRFGLWCGILLPKTRLSYLPDNDDLVVNCLRKYDERVKNKWGRMPLSSFPFPSHVTDIDYDYQDVPFVTLMDILSYQEVTAKFRCVVRVLATLPGHPSEFRAPCGSYRIRLTLEDPTARLHAYVYAEDGVKFFGGYPIPSMDTMIKMQNALLGVEEKETTADVLNEKPRRNPPWVQCCIKSYYIDENDIWGSRRYRIFGTTLIG